MSKLGYKQKGISMLKSPLNIDGVTGVTGVTGANSGLSKYAIKVRKENAEHSARAKTIRQAPGKLFNAITKGLFRSGAEIRADIDARKGNAKSKPIDAQNESNKRRTPSESAGKGIYPSTGKNTTGFQFFDHTTLKPKVLADPPPPPPEGGNGGRSFKDAYAKRDMDTYGSLSQSEFTAEAKRQLKGGKVPGSQMRGSSNKSVNAGIKGPNTEEVAKAKSKLSQLKVDPKGQTITAGKVTKKDILGAKSAKSMSRQEIKGQKEASKKEGKMSRKEIRLQKLNSKAASTKRSTNKTIKSIDSKKAESADTKAKQTSAKSSRAISIDKKARLEKKAGKLKSRIEVQKNNKANREANKKIRKNR